MSTKEKLHTELPANPLPLTGRRVLVTRAAEQAGELVTRLKQAGAIPVECPVIELVVPLDWGPVDCAIAVMETFDWLILTSVNGVRFFFKRLNELRINTDALQNCKICAVGPSTATALEETGIRPDIVPGQFTGEGIVAAFQGIELNGSRVLFPRADGARDLIRQKLTEMGAVVVDPVVYRNIMPENLPEAVRHALEQHQIDVVIFSSPSTVRNLALFVGGIESLKGLLKGVMIASIGPVTTRACIEMGVTVDMEPCKATLDDLISELEQHYRP